MKEMIGGCCVCSDDRGYDENPIVYCDGHGCNVAVHQACYGIITVPSGPWFCRKCESQERAARVRCELCPHKEGALKRTDAGGWCHVVCALYIPEVSFGSINSMEPIILKKVPQDRYNKSCYICEEQGRANKATSGACMQCNYKSGCKQHFHVTCAQSVGYLREESGTKKKVSYCGYCGYHFKKIASLQQKKDQTMLRLNKNTEHQELSLDKKLDKSKISDQISDDGHHSIKSDNSQELTIMSNESNQDATTTTTNNIKLNTDLNDTTTTNKSTTTTNTTTTNTTNTTTNTNFSAKSIGKFTTANFIETTIEESPASFVEIPASCVVLNDIDIKSEFHHNSFIATDDNNNNDIVNDDDDGDDDINNTIDSKSDSLDRKLNYSIKSQSSNHHLRHHQDTNPNKSINLSNNVDDDDNDGDANNEVDDKNFVIKSVPRNTPSVVASLLLSSDKQTYKSGANQQAYDSSSSSSHPSFNQFVSPPRPNDFWDSKQNNVDSLNDSTKTFSNNNSNNNGPLAGKTAPDIKNPMTSPSLPTTANRPQKTTKRKPRIEKKQSTRGRKAKDIHSLATPLSTASDMIADSEDTSHTHQNDKPTNKQHKQQPKQQHQVSSFFQQQHQYPPNLCNNIRFPQQQLPQIPFPSLPTSSSLGSMSTFSLDNLDSLSLHSPTSMEQLLESQWNLGSQFLMQQAQNMDISSLLNHLYKLRTENRQMEAKIGELTTRRNNLLTVNTRLTSPLNNPSKQEPPPNNHQTPTNQTTPSALPLTTTGKLGSQNLAKVNSVGKKRKTLDNQPAGVVSYASSSSSDQPQHLITQETQPPSSTSSSTNHNSPMKPQQPSYSFISNGLINITTPPMPLGLPHFSQQQLQQQQLQQQQQSQLQHQSKKTSHNTIKQPQSNQPLFPLPKLSNNNSSNNNNNTASDNSTPSPAASHLSSSSPSPITIATILDKSMLLTRHPLFPAQRHFTVEQQAYFLQLQQQQLALQQKQSLSRSREPPLSLPFGLPSLPHQLFTQPIHLGEHPSLGYTLPTSSPTKKQHSTKSVKDKQ